MAISMCTQPDQPQPVQCTVLLPLPLIPGTTMKNEAKEMTDFFLNIALMHGFRETDQALLDAVNSGQPFHTERFDAAYELLIADVARYVPPAHA